MKKLSSGIRSIISIRQKTTLNISQLVIDGTEVTDPKHIASAFNHYFVNVPQQVDKAFPRAKKSPIDYLKDRNGHSVFSNATDHWRLKPSLCLLKTVNQLDHTV